MTYTVYNPICNLVRHKLANPTEKEEMQLVVFARVVVSQVCISIILMKTLPRLSRILLNISDTLAENSSGESAALRYDMIAKIIRRKI